MTASTTTPAGVTAATDASTAARNLRIEQEFPGGVGTLTKQGAAHLVNFEITGERGSKVTCSIELAGDGALAAV